MHLTCKLRRWVSRQGIHSLSTSHLHTNMHICAPMYRCVCSRATHVYTHMHTKHGKIKNASVAFLLTKIEFY